MNLIEKYSFALDGISDENKEVFANLFNTITFSCEEYNKNANSEVIRPYEAYLMIMLSKLIFQRNNKVVENIFNLYLQIALQTNRDNNFYNRNNENKLLEELYQLIQTNI